MPRRVTVMSNRGHIFVADVKGTPARLRVWAITGAKPDSQERLSYY